ncbi:hypothetical protein HanIR_Chr16g0803891 [Helianthus annuus]|nr:hypothetical protein HanIR_Chr16g0803891 [Helianthus annuus]
MNIPKVVVSWNSWFTAPLTFAGAISERYSGTVFKFSYKQNSGKYHLQIDNFKLEQNAVFAPKVWPVLRLSSKSFEILPFSSGLLTPSIFLR